MLFLDKQLVEKYILNQVCPDFIVYSHIGMTHSLIDLTFDLYITVQTKKPKKRKF